MKKKQKGKVKFIRVRGRIVPIRSKRERGEKMVKSGLTIAGITGAVSGGLAIGGARQAVKSARATDRASSFSAIGARNDSHRLFRKAAKHSRNAKVNLSFAKANKNIGLFGSSLLLGAGLSNIAEAESGSAKDIGIQSATFAGGVALDKGFKTVFNSKVARKLVFRR